MRRHAFLTLALGLLAPGSALAYSTDQEVRLPVNYFTMVPPTAGQSYLDPVFGTSIRRLSDARNQPNSGDTGNLAFIVNEYSTMSPFNQDNSRILLQHQSYFALYDAEGRYQKDLPFEISASNEPRWSRHDPNLLYYVYGNSLKSYDAASDRRAVVHTFVEYSTVSGRGESDICFDGNHFVLVGDNRYIFVYDVSTDTKGALLDTGGRAFDQLYMTPDDSVLVGWFQAGTGPYSGVEQYDRNMNFRRQVAPVIGHMDVGRDTDGAPVLVWMNAADPQAPADCQNGVVKIRLADGQRTCVVSLDWSLAAHVSVPDAGQWFFVATYAPGDPNPSPGEWRRYTGEVLQVSMDGSEVRRLAHHRSRPFNDYWYAPRAAVSRDGRRLVYSSNYGLPSILGYSRAYSDVYLVDVAASSPSYPGSQLPVSTRYEQDHASVAYNGSWLSITRPVYSGGRAVLAMDAGARSTFTFSGNGVRWIGYRDEWAGIARVYLDGQLKSTVDTYGSPAQAQAVLFSGGELSAGSHALEIEVTRTSNASSAGSWIWLDAFEVMVRAEQDDPDVSYTGTWLDSTLAMHSGGSAMRAIEPGARCSFRFSGNAVSWIGYRDEWSGVARVYLDGVVRADIDTYAAPYQAQGVVYTLSGLPPGEHTLAIEVTTQRNPLSLGYWIWVDAFETPSETAP
jgi:hypothetical protein